MKIAILSMSTAFALLAPCQSVVATLQGRVADAAALVIDGATITLTNLEENTALLSWSVAGSYQFLNLKPGRYRIRVESAGFAVVETSEIQIASRENKRVDFVLLPAGRSDAVDVSASIPVIRTDGGTIADSKSFHLVTRLPTNFRSPSGSLYSVLTVVPGVQGDSAMLYSVAGALPAQAEYTVDGISVADIRRVGPIHLPWPALPESIQELRVTSVGAGASFGALADVTIATKSGTGQLHGSLLWYHQNRILDAAPYGFVRLPKIFNSFSASLGGPLLVPRAFNRYKPAFFFVTYEGTRWPRAVPVELNVPTEQMRSGLLNGVAGPAARDPSTRAPFPDNRIPASAINSVSRRLLDGYYPLPNSSNALPEPNYLWAGRSDENSDRYDLRFDQLAGFRHRFSLRWGRGAYDLVSPNFQPLAQTRVQTTNRNLNTSYVATPGATLSNELRAGFTLYRGRESFPIRGWEAAAALGLQGLNLRHAADMAGFPGFIFPFGVVTSVAHRRPTASQSRTFQVADTVTFVRGTHTISIGAEFRRIGFANVLTRAPGDDFGTFFFRDGFYTGNAFADFLLGVPAATTFAALGPNISESSPQTAAFIQNHWRISPSLSIQAGIRWDLRPPMSEDSGNIATFQSTTGAVIVPDHTLTPSPGFLTSIRACPVAASPTCTKVLRASQAGLPQRLRKTDWNGWGPRLGIAWQPGRTAKTVIRTSAGIYIQTLRGPVAQALAGVYTSDVRTFTNTIDPNGRPLLTLPLILPGAGELGRITVQDFTSGVDPNLRDPRSYQWSLTIERQLSARFSARTSYIGLQSAGLPVLADFNQVPAASVPYTPSLKPFPNWGRLNSIQNLGFANYQAVQFELNLRAANGAVFQTSYVLARNIGMVGAPAQSVFLPQELKTTTLTDRFNTRYDRGELEGTRRRRFLLTGLFPLPRFRSAVPPLRAVLAGWEVSVIALIQSGVFQTPTSSFNVDPSNTNAFGRNVPLRPDRIGDGNTRSVGRFYDLRAFARPRPDVGRFGNSGVGVLEGPGTVAVAGGLSRTTRVGDSLRLRFEATFTNLPNHTNFAPPVVDIDSPLFGLLRTGQVGENAGARTGQLGLTIEF